jgi:hypothetical protein
MGITGEIKRPNASLRSKRISDGFTYITNQKILAKISLFVRIFYTCFEPHPQQY